MNISTNQSLRKAVIIGGSMAGLLTARVISDYFEEVLIIEKDKLPSGPNYRSGVPQAFHPHRVLPRGKIIFEQLFPGYTDDLLAQGAFLRENKGIKLHFPYGSLEVPDERDAGCSRALLEWVIRSRVEQIPNVRFITNHEVIGLAAAADERIITGIHIRDRGDLGSEQQTTLIADMVIDTSGRSSKLGQWLQNIGYELPEQERLKVSLGYSTRHYKIPENIESKWSTILIEGEQNKGKGSGVFAPIENNVAEVALLRIGGDSYPTTNSSEYEQEVDNLWDSSIAEVLRDLEPSGAPRGFRVSECIRNHFEQMTNWPSGLLVLGDALCNFDPVYGQGMTVAAMEAEQLAVCLQEQRNHPQDNFERQVLVELQRVVEPAWWLITVSDLRFSGVEYTGPFSTKGIAFAQQYFDLYLKQTIGQSNMELFEKYMMMTGLLTSPREIINPEMIAAIIVGDTSQEGIQFKAKWLGDNGEITESFLHEIIPTFT
ncbi:NAD(P)/FAD-dependent oxidoreductase [Paenibacillus sp. L3-i20]|uniref:NAD(P)/FAD-dependent oxidoreductase n=1 Tax=Paenibacillus sp. L3-i20 TaxID=2905833 RepID=UPI001EE153EE|nr:FAD dependent oxidoreductase [Paenibacillus sp. L3-i20]GKU78302.1 hypothetical protein L3i20_v226990 [Paenibacillus sp. L3-i20]